MSSNSNLLKYLYRPKGFHPPIILLPSNRASTVKLNSWIHRIKKNRSK